MTKIFPDARDYRTLSIPISAEARAKIEKTTGFLLLPGQQDRFQYFEMIGDGRRTIGVIIAASQKGEYGAVEFVFGVGVDGRIKNIYVQRARERDQSFKERAFLDLFVDRSIEACEAFGALYKGEPSPGTTAVIQGLVKELVCYRILVPAVTAPAP